MVSFLKKLLVAFSAGFFASSFAGVGLGLEEDAPFTLALLQSSFPVAFGFSFARGDTFCTGSGTTGFGVSFPINLELEGVGCKGGFSSIRLTAFRGPYVVVSIVVAKSPSITYSDRRSQNLS